jgi:16S rRNA processing protein RimM
VNNNSQPRPPENLVVMGRIVAPFGVKGWVKIEPFTAAAKNLSAYPRWWIGDGTDWEERGVTEARAQGRVVVARIAGCDDRDAAASFTGRQIAVPRAQLPIARANEYYWADLIGLDVVNEAGRDFGKVIRILETGANDVLVVQGERERLIPFIADVIAAIDLQAGLMRVNWDADF